MKERIHMNNSVYFLLKVKGFYLFVWLLSFSRTANGPHSSIYLFIHFFFAHPKPQSDKTKNIPSLIHDLFILFFLSHMKSSHISFFFYCYVSQSFVITINLPSRVCLCAERELTHYNTMTLKN